MKKIFILCMLFLIPLVATAYSKYPDIISTQLELLKKMDADDLNKEMMLKLVQEKKHAYILKFEDVLINKNDFRKNIRTYDDNIYALTKIIKQNRRLGNTYAQERDKVKIKIYTIFNAHKVMVDNILIALDSMTFQEFSKYLEKLIKENNTFIENLNSKKYDGFLTLKDNSQTLKELQNNIIELENIVEINSDMLSYLIFFKQRIYGLNKYADYGLINLILKLNNISSTKTINETLEKTGLSIVKMLMVIIVSLIIFLINKYFFRIIEKMGQKLQSNKNYIPIIFKNIKKYLTISLIILNIQLVIFILNNFVTYYVADMIFEVAHSIVLTFIILKILNTISTVKITQLEKSKIKIKSEIINVSIKIINFIIVIIGALLILHSLGINLTAVLSGLGIGGFAVALASKDSLANFFGTISILASDTFSQGDWIVTEKQEGTVVEIGLRVTTIRTFDNALISIPNANLANTDIVNWSKRELGRRIKMSLGIKYNSKSENIKKAIEQIRAMLIKHPNIASKNTEFTKRKNVEAKILSYEDAHGIKRNLLVYLDEFSDSSITILIYCFTKTIDWHGWLDVKEDVMHKIMEILEENNLEFAFPSLSIYNEK